MLIQAEAAQEAIDTRRSEPCGVVRMTCPTALLHARAADMVAEYMARHPKVTVHLDATDRRVDVVGEGIDLAIRVRPLPLEDSDLVLRKLGDRRQCVVAAPDLLDREGRPDAPSGLARLPSLALGPPQDAPVWHLVRPDGTAVRIGLQPRLVTQSMAALRIAALAGVGVVQLPAMMMAAELRDGRLVEALPGWAPPAEVIHAVFPSRRGQIPAVRALIDHLAARFRALDEE